jgi:PST family polysaccharide transporter
LITATYLTRTLGAVEYGQISLVYAASAPVMWLASTTFAGRAAVKLIADADDWRAMAAALLRANALVGLLATVLFALAVPMLGSVFKQPALTPYLWLAACEISLMPITRLHRDALTARGRYTSPALATLAYHSARVVLVLGLVAAGWSVMGVIVANMAARLVELATCRAQQRLPVRGGVIGSLAPLREFFGSLFVYALCLQLFNRVDLLMVGWLGSPDTVGHYGAAQNLAQGPGLFALVFTPLLIAALRRAELDGAVDEAAALRLESARVALGLWALAAPVAAGATGLAVLLFGPAFAASGAILAWLGIAGGAALVLSVHSAHEVADGRFARPLIAAIPMLVVAVVLQILLIPRYGGAGAAVATAVAAVLGALIAQGFQGVRKLPSRGLDLLRAIGGGMAGFLGTRLAAIGNIPSPVDMLTGCLVTCVALLALRLTSTSQISRFASELAGRDFLTT